ncbi:hypothetical protein LCGC14_2436400 [marine sediment metagenome]|uniref:Uncharacterized protein n=1 Tax=marine sediment metagenome TaxID=412755 RepID=A0A0F9BKB1_9ZZZZ
MPDKKLTPDELTAKIIEHDIFWDGVETTKKKGGYLLYTKKERIELIKEYARQKCKKQRYECNANFRRQSQREDIKWSWEQIGAIENAKEPEFD